MEQNLILKQSTSTACGKCIIVGEHAVIYNAYAVAVPLKNFKITLNLTPLSTNSQDKQYCLYMNDKQLPDHLVVLIKKAFQELNIRPQAIEIRAHSNLLVGGGLGSSASLCISILKALADAAAITLTPEELNTKANELEKIFHGNPSGLDTSVVASEKAILFRRGKKPVPFITKPLWINNKEYPWTFVLIDSEERTATLTMIDKSRPFFTSPKQKTTIEDFNNCALMTKKGFMESSLQLVAQAMNHTSKLLEEASVVSEKTKEMITTSLDIGALAAKTTGAGGGGCILVLLDPTQKVQQIEQLTDCYGEKNIHEFNL